MAKGKKTGGRQKGTPNKENPIKGYLRAHSLSYFEPKPQTEADGSPRKIDFTDKDGVILSSRILADADGNPIQMSDFDVDMMVLDANERVSAELRLLEFHTPKMKAVEVIWTFTAQSSRLRTGYANYAEKMKRMMTDAPSGLFNLLLDATIGFYS